MKHWLTHHVQSLSWKSIGSFVTRGTDLSRLPLIKLIILAAGIVTFVFWAAIEQRSSTIVEWLLNPDHAIYFTADWRSDHPFGAGVTVVDIDNASFNAWGRPAWTPRTKLFDLVDMMDRRGAAAIVVDIDLTAGPTISELETAKRRLDEYLVRVRPAGVKPAPLIFVHKLWTPYQDQNISRGVQVPIHGTDRAYSDALSRLSDTVNSDRDTDAPQTIWASALFNSETNGSIRFWHTIEAACSEGQALGFPSVGLATAAILTGQSNSITALRRDGNIYADRFCRSQFMDAAQASDDALNTSAAEGGGVVIPWMALRKTTTRLPFLFWQATLEPFRFGTARTTTGRIVPLLEILSAKDLLKADPPDDTNVSSADPCSKQENIAASRSCSAVAGRVVAIGASHIDSSDSYFTLLGSMPGVYILANTMAAARDTLIRKPSRFQNPTLWAVVLFLIFVVLVARLRAVFAIIAASLVTIFFLASLSGWVGLSTASTYHSVNASIVMLAIFLTTGSFFIDLESRLRSAIIWIAGKWRA